MVLLFVWMSVVRGVYIQPCQEGSLVESNYSLDSSGYFCVEPPRLEYSGDVNENIYVYNAETAETPKPSVQPCNCYGQSLVWRTTTVPYTCAEADTCIYTGYLELISNQSIVPWNAVGNTACQYWQGGITWNVAPEGVPNPNIPTIPPGGFVSVYKTGSSSDTFQAYPQADPCPCGVTAQHSYQSVRQPTSPYLPRESAMPISQYCQENESFTDKAFKATVTRYATLLQHNAQCTMGFDAAFTLMSGGQPRESTILNTIKQNNPNFDYSLYSIYFQNISDYIFACNGHDLAIVVESAVNHIAQYALSLTYGSDVFKYNIDPYLIPPFEESDDYFFQQLSVSPTANPCYLVGNDVVNHFFQMSFTYASSTGETSLSIKPLSQPKMIGGKYGSTPNHINGTLFQLPSGVNYNNFGGTYKNGYYACLTAKDVANVEGLNDLNGGLVHTCGNSNLFPSYGYPNMYSFQDLCSNDSIYAFAKLGSGCTEVYCLPQIISAPIFPYNSTQGDGITNNTKYNINTYTGRIAFVEQLAAIANYLISYGTILLGNPSELIEKFLNYLQGCNSNPSSCGITDRTDLSKLSQIDLVSLESFTEFSEDTSGTTTVFLWGTFATLSGGFPSLSSIGPNNPFAINGYLQNISHCLSDYTFPVPGLSSINFAPAERLGYFSPSHVEGLFTTFFSQPLFSQNNERITNGFLGLLYQMANNIEIGLLPLLTISNIEAQLGYNGATLDVCSPENEMWVKTAPQDWAKDTVHKTQQSLYREYVAPFSLQRMPNVTFGSVGCFNYKTFTFEPASGSNPYCYYQITMSTTSADVTILGGIMEEASYGTYCYVDSDESAATVVCYCPAQTTICNIPVPWNVIMEVLFFLIANGDLSEANNIFLGSSYPAYTQSEGFPYLYDSLTTQTNLPDFFHDQTHCTSTGTELPSFVNPWYQYTDTTGSVPPSLTEDGINIWCGLFNNTCTTRSMWCMQNGSSCVIRKYNYGTPTVIKETGDFRNVPDPLCAWWDPMMDNINDCQNTAYFTGCLLVNVTEYCGNTTNSSNVNLCPSKSSGSMPIPNSYRRLISTSSVTEPKFYTMTVSALIFQVPTGYTNDFTCSCRYASAGSDVLIERFNLNVTNNIIDLRTYTSDTNNSMYQLNPLVYQNLIYQNLSSSIDVLVPVLFSTDGMPNADLARLSIRCDCPNNIVLARRAFHELNQDIFFATDLRNYTTSTVPFGRLFREMRCVPIAMKTNITTTVSEIETSAISSLFDSGSIYMTLPIACDALAYLTNAFDVNTNMAAINVYKKNCADQMNAYGGFYMQTFNNYNQAVAQTFWYLNIGNTLRQTSQYATLLNASNSVGAYFFDQVSRTGGAYNYANPGSSLPSSLYQGQRCSSTSTVCGFMIDATFLIPCQVLANVQVPLCSKPQLQLLYPEIDPAEPLALGQIVNFPVNAWKWRAGMPAFTLGGVQTGVLQAAVNQSKPYSWDVQLTMIHYCDTYFGAPVYCDNDPLSITRRQQICQLEGAQYLFSGSVLGAFTINDICPFLIDASKPRECYIFVGNNFLGSLSNVLAMTRCNNQNCDWSGVTFYIVPFSELALKYLLLNPAVADTLISNRFDVAESEILTKENIDLYGANAQLLAGKRIQLLNTWSPEPGVAPNVTLNRIWSEGICNRAIGLSLNVIRFYNALLQAHESQPGIYKFTSLASTGNTTASIYVPASSIIFPWIPLNVLVPYNEVTIRPAIGTELIAAPPTNGSLNLESCVRFNIHGNGFTIENLTVYQTGPCKNLSVIDTLPIMFNPPSAIGSVVKNLNVIGTSLGVGFLGINNIIDCSDSIISNVTVDGYNHPYVVITSKSVGTYYVANPISTEQAAPLVGSDFTPPSTTFTQGAVMLNNLLYLNETQVYATSVMDGYLTLKPTEFPVEYNNSYLYVTQYSEPFYVFVNTTTMTFQLSTSRASVFFIDFFNSAVHVNNNPLLCFTQRGSSYLTLEPCLKDYIGAQIQPECRENNEYELTQWVNYELQLSETLPGYCWTGFREDASMSVSIVPELSNVIPLAGTTINESIQVYNNTINGFYMPCEPCLWISENFALNLSTRFYSNIYNICSTAVGVTRFACNGYSSAGLMGVKPPECSSTILQNILVNGEKFGYGARISCMDDGSGLTWQVVSSGYGYMPDELLRYGNLTATVYATLIHPTNLNPTVLTKNTKVVDLTAFNNHSFGSIVDALIYNGDIFSVDFSWTGTIILGVIFIFEILLIMFTHTYHDEPVDDKSD